MKIYLASSWRNLYQREVLVALRGAGHEVYDFKNPAPGNEGFSWKQIDPDLKNDLSVARMRNTLAHPISNAGFKCDFDAMKWADACVLLLPSGMSAHLEAGWFAGMGKPVVCCAPEIREPELMYKVFDDEAGATPMFETVREVIAQLAITDIRVECPKTVVDLLGEWWGLEDEQVTLKRAKLLISRISDAVGVK